MNDKWKSDPQSDKDRGITNASAEALTNVIRLLEPLTPAERQRVLSTVSVYLKVDQVTR